MRTDLGKGGHEKRGYKPSLKMYKALKIEDPSQLDEKRSLRTLEVVLKKEMKKVHHQNPIQLASCCWPSTSYSRTSWSLTSKSCLTSPWTSSDSCYQNPQNSAFLVEYCAAFLNSTIKEI